MNEYFFEECRRCGEQVGSHETVWQVGAPRPKRRFFCRPCKHGWESGVAEERICKAYIKPLEYLGGVLGNCIHYCILPAAYGHDRHEGPGPDPWRWTDSYEGAGYR